jgi:hypothetical protein
MEIIGCILVRKLDQREGIGQRSGLKWVVAEYLIEMPGQFTRHARISVKKEELIRRFDALVGKNVNVSFDINANESNGRWFNELVAWGLMEYVTEHRTPVTTVADMPTNGDPAVITPEAANAETARPQIDPETGETHADGLPF